MTSCVFWAAHKSDFLYIDVSRGDPSFQKNDPRKSPVNKHGHNSNPAFDNESTTHRDNMSTRANTEALAGQGEFHASVQPSKPMTTQGVSHSFRDAQLSHQHWLTFPSHCSTSSVRKSAEMPFPSSTPKHIPLERLQRRTASALTQRLRSPAKGTTT